jgi:hypothetical protein
VKNALKYIQNTDNDSLLEIDILNAQFTDFEKKVGPLENMVAMVDQSGSMYVNLDTGLAAIGLGIIVANKSVLGKRILCFSEEPSWISLEKCSNFYECNCELALHSHKAGYNTNFYKALMLILDACIEQKLPDSVVSNMTLAIFSDMQIDAGDISSAPFATMYDKIVMMYTDAGYSAVPHILFWNLTSSTGFPSLTNKKGTSMMSGYSPLLLNVFCEKGIDALYNLTAWTMLVDSLNVERYKILEDFVLSYLK